MTDAAPAIDSTTDATTTPDVPRPESKPFNPPLPALWVFLACLLVALFCNAGGLRGEGFIGVEQTLIRDNDLLNRLPGLQALWFRAADPATYPLPQYAPLAQTTFFVEHAIWGNTPWAYRLTSVVLHAAVGLMIWLLLRRLSVAGGFVAALLFVAHPMTVDSVSWLGERRTTLAALLGLSSAYLLFRASGVIAPGTGKVKLLPDDPIRLYAMGALLFILALFSSAAVATMPLVVLLVAWWKRTDPRARASAALTGTCVALLIAGMGMLALTSSIEKARSGVPSAAAWNRASSDAGELIVRSQIAGRAVAFYAQKLVVPFPISISYPRWQTPRDVEQFRTFAADRAKAEARRPDVAPGSVLSYAFPVLVAGALIASWLLRDRLGRGQFVAVAGFVLLLAPSLGFIDLGWMRYTFVSNHAAYLASVPFLAGIAWLGGTLLARANDRTVTVSSAGIVIVICAILSLMISLRFRNPSYFWVQNARAFATFRSWLPRYELAASLIDERDPSGQKQAMQAADEIIDDLRPEEPGPLVVRGILKQRRGDEVGAFADFERSMQTFPTYAPAFFEAGNAFSRRADLRPTDPLPRLTAMQLFQEAAARDPLDAWSRVRLGQTRWEIARRLDWQDPSRDTFYDKAAEALDEAVQLRAYDVDLLVTVSETLVEMRRLGEAGRFLESARSIDPSRAETYVVLGDAFLAGGNATGTEASLRTAIGLSPRFVIARLRLAALHQMQGRWNEARDQLTRVLELNPDHAEAKRRLAEIEAAATTRPSL